MSAPILGISARSGLLLYSLLLAPGLGGCSKKDASASTSTTASASPAAITPAATTTPSPEACRACEQRGVCAELSDGCAKFEGDAKAKCEAVDHCVQTSNCADGDKTFTSCYCGALGTGACLEAPLTGEKAPAGPCADVIRAAYGEVTKNSQVLTRFIKAEYPGGAALARRNCDKVDPACKAVCGF